MPVKTIRPPKAPGAGTSVATSMYGFCKEQHSSSVTSRGPSPSKHPNTKPAFDIASKAAEDTTESEITVTSAPGCTRRMKSAATSAFSRPRSHSVPITNRFRLERSRRSGSMEEVVLHPGIRELLNYMAPQTTDANDHH